MNKCIEMFMNGESISEICRTTFTQACHLCEREDCCDNTNPLIKRIKEFENMIEKHLNKISDIINSNSPLYCEKCCRCHKPEEKCDKTYV